MPADLDVAAAAVLSWLLTYAIHSTILLAGAAVAAWRFADHHAWLDPIWKAAVIAPLVTASLHVDPIALPLGARWAMPAVTSAAGDARGPGSLSADAQREAGEPPTMVTPAPKGPAHVRRSMYVGPTFRPGRRRSRRA